MHPFLNRETCLLSFSVIGNGTETWTDFEFEFKVDWSEDKLFLVWLQKALSCFRPTQISVRPPDNHGEMPEKNSVQRSGISVFLTGFRQMCHIVTEWHLRGTIAAWISSHGKSLKMASFFVQLALLACFHFCKAQETLLSESIFAYGC